jgi:folate-binding Fe-S cluster repair protein YgfZ
MQHRGTARKRFVIVAGDAALPPAKTEVTAGEEPRAVIGAMGSSAGTSGLALVRLDRAAEMLAKGQTIRAGDVEVTLRVPSWAPYTLSAQVRENEAAP